MESSIIDYKVGREYPFTINAIYDDFCELMDEGGFRVYLQHTNGYQLARGQRVVCRVLKKTMLRPRIELVDAELKEKSRADAKAVADILKEQGTGWDSTDFARLLLMVERENSFETECRHWIATQRDGGVSLEALQADLMRFMEQSGFLALCTPVERERYQQRLSLLVELLGDNVQAHRLMTESKEEEFVEQLFEKLRCSGYVYRPDSAFNVLSCLFLAKRQLMEGKMPQLFDILRRWQVEMWRGEPFNGVLVKLLQLYIDECIWDLDKVRDNSALVDNLTQALTIQLLIAEDKADTDLYRQDLSRICTLATYKNRMPDPLRTMRLALCHLLGTRTPLATYSLTDTVSPTVAYKIGNELAPSLTTVNCFLHDHAKLVVDGRGLTLHVLTGAAPKEALPASLGLWQGMQVLADRSAVKALGEKPTVAECKQLWADIEQEIFAAQPKPLAAPKKQKHRVGQTVKIAITYQDEQDPSKFYCRIADDIGGEGYLYVSDIVPYAINAYMHYFKSYEGRTLLLDAQITESDVDGFHFSMLDEIKSWAKDSYEEDDEMECWLGADSPKPGSNACIPAITRHGVSVSLGGFDELDYMMKKGDVVQAAYLNAGEGTFHVRAKVKRLADSQYLDLGDAFHELMIAHANGAVEAPAAVEESEFEQNDRILSVAYVKEIVRIIDRLAVIDSEYVKAYCYLGFARVLCRMVGWEQQATYYRGRMELIVMLHDFAVNDMVDEARLRGLETMNADLFQSNKLLRNRFLQLQAVSCMGKESPERDGQLWQTYIKGSGLVKDVASLVIAYNMVSRNGMERQAANLQNRIKQTLRLEGYESNLKIYGTGVEDDETEYKTSIVYPSDNNMLPNMEKQLKNILYVIASFLNTRGGTIYIGVNDFGAGVGLENDLAYTAFHGDKDKYQRTLIDAVAKEWGNLVATYVSVAFDKANADKDVLIVNVRPYAEGVKFDGKWWVRVESTKRGLDKAGFERFVADNRNLPEASATVQPETQPAETAAEPEPPAVFTVSARESNEALPTSPWRRNALEDYMDDFVPYEACLKLLDKGKWSKVESYDYDPSLLTLAVYEEEKDDYLVLGYADGSMAKVPVKELLKCENRRKYARSTDSPLRFASIAKDDDGLVSVTREDKGKGRLMVRVDTIRNIEERRIAEKGVRLYKEGMASEVVAYGVIPADGLGFCKNLIDRNDRSLGWSLDGLSEDQHAQLDKWMKGPQ